MESLSKRPTGASWRLPRVRLRESHRNLALTHLRCLAEAPARSNLKKPLHPAPTFLAPAILISAITGQLQNGPVRSWGLHTD